MRYGERTKVKAKIGDVIKFRYTGGTDATPTILFMNSAISNEKRKLIVGFNLNYFDNYKDVSEFIQFTHKVMKTGAGPKAVYDRIIKKFPKVKDAYRVYHVGLISAAVKLDFKTLKTKYI